MMTIFKDVWAWHKKKYEPKPEVYCVNCKYFHIDVSGVLYKERCRNPKVVKTNKVTGEPGNTSCGLARISPCGVEGKFFEPKEETNVGNS